jgi:hypothetical protein
MELDFQSLFGLIYEGAIGQPRWTTFHCDPLRIRKAILLTMAKQTKTEAFMMDYGGITNGVRSSKFIWAPVYICTHWLRPPP